MVAGGSLLGVAVPVSVVAPPEAPVALDVGASSEEPTPPSVSAVAVVVAARATLRPSSSCRADDGSSPPTEHTAAATKASKVRASRATPAWFFMSDVRRLAGDARVRQG